MGNEDKMRQEFRKLHPNSEMQEQFAEAWKACAAIKDAEITNLEKHNKDLRDNALANEQANYSQIERLVKERASRDLMIKELREAISNAVSVLNRMEVSVPTSLTKALDNSEHHNSKVLEKMLLEAEIKGLRNQQPVSCNARLIDCCNKLAELNKE